jgi:dipeptidyl aminopeptidase/acylaminoacyl peptidase
MYHGVKMKVKKDADGIKKYIFESKIPTIMELAANLKGKLLLVTGDMDINVHPANTFRLANALIKADKLFDMMVIPGADHSIDSPYYFNLLRHYFAEHLLGGAIE